MAGIKKKYELARNVNASGFWVSCPTERTRTEDPKGFALLRGWTWTLFQNYLQKSRRKFNTLQPRQKMSLCVMHVCYSDTVFVFNESRLGHTHKYTESFIQCRMKIEHPSCASDIATVIKILLYVQFTRSDMDVRLCQN